MQVSLINRKSDEISEAFLRELYDQKLIPPEKKPFLIDLARSTGPLMAIADGHFILDVASQIASLGLGFNAGAMFGASQFLESWTGQTDTDTVQVVRRSFRKLLQSILGWRSAHLHFCQSGAEAIETALGHCYQRRINRRADKILAFENSFHGRTMVALSATWNPAKREPFAWPGYDVVFAKYPELKSDDVLGPPVPNHWQRVWSASPYTHFDRVLEEHFGQSPSDELFAREVATLQMIRQHLLTGQFYAILIEPMQCEGGDRYSSARFHHALINLAKACDVPLVYDEVQTGFGLGGDFFWHSKFNLTDGHGDPLQPECVVMAKKAQLGAVLTHDPVTFPEQFNASSLFRGFIQASMIDQFQSEIDKIESANRRWLATITQRYAPRISDPRASGVSFAFDFQRESDLQRFVESRFTHGLLYYPAGQRAARFRFNLSFRSELLDRSWEQIDAALAATFGGNSDLTSSTVQASGPESYFDFHAALIDGKLARLQPPPRTPSHDIQAFILKSLESDGVDTSRLSVVQLEPDNFDQFRDAIWQTQLDVYEPLRQTPIEKFETLVQSENQLSLLVTEGDKIIGMAFAAPPCNFPNERGVKLDEYFDDPNTVYMLDLTVIPTYRGCLGRILKQALCLAAQQSGLAAIQGRNRDRLARGMWAINLSLGSYCTRVLKDDYLDNEVYRDCLMYRCPVQWQPQSIQLSTAIRQPLSDLDLDMDFVRQYLPVLTNKLTLSNFVTREFLGKLAEVFELLPESLRHGYSASGISECVDKIVKSLWLRRQPRRRLVTFAGQYFGAGSFLSRSLSGIGEPYFPVTALPVPDHDHHRTVVELETTLDSDEILAVFVEPLGSRTGQRLAEEFLAEIRQLCRDYETPIIFHDSAGAAYRYSHTCYLPSSHSEFLPDAGVLDLGGQMAICYLDETYFVDTPLTMISTWDGDAFSLAQFHRAMKNIENDVEGYLRLKRQFHRLLMERLDANQVTHYQLNDGVGRFRGQVETDLARMFQRADNGDFVCCPSYGQMQKFVNVYSSHGEPT